MKIAMYRYFVPTSYKQRPHLQFTRLTHGSKIVDEYTRLLYSLATRSEFSWHEDVLIYMLYWQGLNPQISCGLGVSRLYHMANAVQVAFKLKKRYRKRLQYALQQTQSQGVKSQRVKGHLGAHT